MIPNAEQGSRGAGEQGVQVLGITYRVSRITYHASRIMFIALILLATWLRLWQLNAIPPGLWFDEAYNAMDSLWMVDTETWPVFLRGNNGREVMFHYLLAPAITILGETAYAVRLVPVLISILTLPLMYRFSLTLFKGASNVQWLALISTAGLVTSFWNLTMNRAGYRANLLPLFALAVSYFFWRGWKSGKKRHYFLAGIGFGLAQYTYLSARLLPLVFLLFVAIQTFLGWHHARSQIKSGWAGLFMMAGVSIVVSGPLLYFFASNSSAFWSRVSDVAVKVDGSPESFKLLAGHLWQAIRVFFDGEDPNWRHHLMGRPAFDWINTIGFVVGLFITIKQYRRAVYLFLLLSLFVMWLPAPLSDPPLHTLRLAGILPAYYILVAIGLISLVGWLNTRLHRPLSNWQVGLTTLFAFLLLSGGLTFYDYFYRWAKSPQVYQAFDGSVVELANYLTSSEAEDNLIIPFYLYTHASVRYLLHDNYLEDVLLPPDFLAQLHHQEETTIVIPKYPEDDGQPLTFVWLFKNESGPGVAYVSEVERDVAFTAFDPEPSQPIRNNRGNVIADRYRVDTEDVLPLFPGQPPKNKVGFEWVDNLMLTGYEFIPPSLHSDSFGSLLLSWEILGHTGLREKMFVQLLDSQGNPLGQREIDPLSRKLYRWRDDGLILEEHPLDFEVDLDAGLYFVRLGFFDPETDQRLPVYNAAQQSIGDEVIVGPFPVSANGVEPTMPQYSVEAKFGHEFELLGYSIYPSAVKNTTQVELFWRAIAPVSIDYTVSVQLLDQHNRIIAQADAQPLQNIYPTSRWQPGDVLSDRFDLAVDYEQLSKSNRLVAGMYDLSTGVRLPVYDNKSQILPDGMITLQR